MSKLARKSIQEAPKLYSKEAHAKATELARRARDGEILSITGIAELPGGNMEVFGSVARSRQRIAGMLLDAAIKRLGYEWDD